MVPPGAKEKLQVGVGLLWGGLLSRAGGLGAALVILDHLDDAHREFRQQLGELLLLLAPLGFLEGKEEGGLVLR